MVIFFIVRAICQKNLTLTIDFVDTDYVASIKIDGLDFKAMIDTGSSQFTAKVRGCQGPPLVKLKICFKQSQRKTLKYLDGDISGGHCSLQMIYKKFKGKVRVFAFDKCSKRYQVDEALMGLHHSNTTIYSNMFSNKLIQKEAFTIFFGMPKGFVNLGILEMQIVDSKKSVIKQTYKPKEISLPLTQIKLGTSIKKYSAQLTLDCGSTFTLFPKAEAEFILNQFKKITTIECGFTKQEDVPGLFLGDCDVMKANQRSKAPNLLLKFKQKFQFNGQKFFYSCQKISSVQQSCYLAIAYIQGKNIPSLSVNFLVNTVILVDATAASRTITFAFKKP